MSEWYQLENKYMAVQLTSAGAEMKRLFAKFWRRELLWQPTDELSKKLWNRSAPVLFPIVGKLKDDEYIFQDKSYSMPQHGFARDREFKCIECVEDRVDFKLEASQETFKMYPFCFELYVSYQLIEAKLVVSYKVVNVDRQDIYFSLGAHPGFNILDLEDYEVHFQTQEKKYYRLNHNSCVDWAQAYPMESDVLKISKSLFSSSAMIFKDMKSKYVDIIDHRHHHSMRLYRGESPFFGVWGKGDVPFVCLEPWWGVADEEGHNKNLVEKRGIMKLAAGKCKTLSFAIELLS